ncbi:MAG TPA: hypothetical protein ENI26_04950 [Methylophaga aminisulfidivorans]|uniref:Phospholipase D-like domain-containing protein n=1 Tax=Methylophaga aminisulfidivorans TaxID=230105 RepID=A0A7C1ZGS1_9GAMM|nr:hypothetical protein [Methylophaga aminisulfidivorans]
MKMRPLYKSGDVHKAIKEIFDPSASRRVAVVAYLGVDAEKFLPSPKGVRIICCPEPGATSPDAIRSLHKKEATIEFSDDLHAKVYWSDIGCVITSANLSYRALGNPGQHEAGVLIDSGDYDIDKLIKLAKPYDISAKAMKTLVKNNRRILNSVKDKKKHNNTNEYLDWYDSFQRDSWKMGWYTSSDMECSDAANIKAKDDYDVNTPKLITNVSKGQMTSHDWVLSFKINGNKLTSFVWMYVDFVVDVNPKDKKAYEENYPLQAIQVNPSKYYADRPFHITPKFRVAFNKAVNDYKAKNLIDNKSLVPQKSLLKKVAEYMRDV